MIDQEKELKKLRELLVQKREEWRSGSFLDDIHFNSWNGIIYDIKVLFQRTMAELDELEIRYSALKETLKNEYRQSIKSPSDASQINSSTDVFHITVRRNYEYDEEYLHKQAIELGVDPETFYKTTKKFDYRLVPDELKEALIKSKSLKGITTSFKDKWD